jgi:hypothetical protein
MRVHPGYPRGMWGIAPNVAVQARRCRRWTVAKVFALLVDKAGYNLRNLRVNGLRPGSRRIFRAYPAHARAVRRTAGSVGQ